MPCSPRDARAVVAKNHVLGRTMHTPQTRPGGTPPGVLPPSTAVGNVTPLPSCAAEAFSNGKYDKYGGFAAPRHAMTARRAGAHREPVSARGGAGAGRTGYLGVGSSAAEPQPCTPGRKFCASGKLRSAHSVSGPRPQDQSSPGTRRPRLPKRLDKRQPVLCRSATCRANIFVTITNGPPRGWAFRGKSSRPAKYPAGAIFPP
jgi:hypothetical protein